MIKSVCNTMSNGDDFQSVSKKHLYKPFDVESVINIISCYHVSKTVSICMYTTQYRNAFKWRYKQNVPKGGGSSSVTNYISR